MKWFIRWTATVAVLLCATVAAWASYTHVYDLALYYHQRPPIVYAYPLTVDGLIYCASMVLLHQSMEKTEERSVLAYSMIVLGVLVSAVANVWSGLRGGPGAAAVAAWPVVPLVFGYELLMVIIRAQANKPVVADIPDASDTLELVTAGENTGPSHRREPEETPAVALPSRERARHARGAPTLNAVEQAFLQEITHGQVPSISAIMDELQVGSQKAHQYQTHIREKGRAVREAAPVIQ